MRVYSLDLFRHNYISRFGTFLAGMDISLHPERGRRHSTGTLWSPFITLHFMGIHEVFICSLCLDKLNRLKVLTAAGETKHCCSGQK